MVLFSEYRFEPLRVDGNRSERKLCVFQYLLDGRNPFEDVSKTILTQSLHSELLGFLLQDDRRGSLRNKISNRIAHIEEFEETLSSLVSGVVAGITTLPGVELSASRVGTGQSELREHG
jgi:hypothetical protein